MTDKKKFKEILQTSVKPACQVSSDHVVKTFLIDLSIYATTWVVCHVDRLPKSRTQFNSIAFMMVRKHFYTYLCKILDEYFY